MRTALTALALAAAALLTPAATVTATAAPALADDAPASAPGPVPNQGYSIPVGAITDLGALPVLGGLGNDFAHLLGQ
ncbi:MULTISPECIES: hypothetical protein [Kitasatospora]|uniref:Secreted protein n=1 Tax=Kitasatospora setae (strain ATCC 33774 / DSM 43861 / JCM 3304 / KCC A-0304 / NBRC 14216 / KM-6054) TaxID=452652 RepID=E4NIP9_KITSK|nr:MULTISPECIES: hypothetical protein [Kitasatospora]BAJ32847.1 hypothetical protein KSE_70910 [Kitasatospora setae KM-6054]